MSAAAAASRLAINLLDPNDPIVQMRTRLRASLDMSPLARAKELEEIKKDTGMNLGALREELAKLKSESPDAVSPDTGSVLAAHYIRHSHNKGATVITGPDALVWEFNGKVWVRRSPQQVKNALTDLIVRGKVILDMELNDHEAKVVDEAYKILCNRSGTSAEDDPFNFLAKKPDMVLACENGEVRVHRDGTITFGPHSPASRCTRFHTAQYIEGPVTLPRKARRVFLQMMSNRGKCDKDKARFVLKILAYALARYKFMPAAFFIFIGEGGDGKSSLGSVLAAIMGDALANESVSVLSKVFDNDSLITASAMIDDDMDEYTILPAARLKQISERKKLKVAVKYGQPVSFYMNLLSLSFSNGLPSVRDITDGFWRRAHAVPFLQRFVTKDSFRENHEKDVLIYQTPKCRDVQKCRIAARKGFIIWRRKKES